MRGLSQTCCIQFNSGVWVLRMWWIHCGCIYICIYISLPMKCMFMPLKCDNKFSESICYTVLVASEHIVCKLLLFKARGSRDGIIYDLFASPDRDSDTSFYGSIYGAVYRDFTSVHLEPSHRAALFFQGISCRLTGFMIQCMGLLKLFPLLRDPDCFCNLWHGAHKRHVFKFCLMLWDLKFLCICVWDLVASHSNEHSNKTCVGQLK